MPKHNDANLDDQIPDNQEQAQAAGCIEDVLGGALPLCRLLQLLVSASHILRREE